jgi:hypothetical protein
MTRSKKARSAALSAQVNCARLKRKLKLLREEGVGVAKHKAWVRAFVAAGRALFVRRACGHEAQCTVKVVL